ncbi:MAG: RIP metalloprotease RseP [Clostridia bacterium]|nr:RIP metalloprotease RseP [Clostridia bacterium]
MTIICALLVFCLLIFTHEFGHFIVAKAVGVKVNEFSLGMGPALFSRQKGETLYSLRLLPIGGYCAMEGEDEESDDARAFNKKPAWAKIAVIFAGPFMNVVTAVIVMTIIVISLGVATCELDTVDEGGPAWNAGVRPGDVVTAMDGQPIEHWNDIRVIATDHKSDDVSLTVERDGREMTFEMKAERAEDGRSVVGINPVLSRNPVKALGYGAKACWNMLTSMVDILHSLFNGEVPVSDLSGPVGVVYAVNTTIKHGAVYLGYLTALISLNLALVNLLPFPALDGGRIVFVIIRLFTGRVITDAIEAKVHFAGIILLFALMIYVTWQDIVRFIVPIVGG